MKTDFSQTNPDLEYNLAQDRVRKITRFYKHCLVYLVVNLIFLIINYQSYSSDFFSFHNFSTAFFWGIGLMFHALGVFGPNVFFGKNWEQRKIKELMEKDKVSKSQWS